jgi:hypothetical protein
MGQDCRAHADSGIHVDEAATLLDVEFDESPDAREAIGFGTEGLRIASRSGQRFREGDAVDVSQRERAIRREHSTG